MTGSATYINSGNQLPNYVIILKQVIIDNFIWENGMMLSLEGPESDIILKDVHVKNIEKVSGGNLIRHTLRKDDTPSYNNCIFENVCFNYYILFYFNYCYS
jgi:hypothetical protein